VCALLLYSAIYSPNYSANCGANYSQNGVFKGVNVEILEVFFYEPKKCAADSSLFFDKANACAVAVEYGSGCIFKFSRGQSHKRFLHHMSEK
jgi:hypothetical protein